MPRSRRSCHAVPGSSERFLAKAPSLDADEVFLDLEDAVAESEKARARELVIAALREQDFGRATVVVRVNGTDTPHYYRDMIDVVEQAGDRLHAVMVPKVRTPGDVEMTDKLLTGIELARGLPAGAIGIEAQIEDATGLLACEAIAAASPRMETLIFGPGDYSAAVGIPITTIGGTPDHYPGDHLNYVYSRLVVAARAAGIQAIDGPTRRSTTRTACASAPASPARSAWTASGRSTRARSPSSTRSSRPRARSGSAPRRCSRRTAAAAGEGRGAAMFDGEMIDEANRKMAERLAEAGRAAGY